jgi:hypothetical protein
VILGSELNPGNVPVLSLLGRDGVGQEVGPREEPATTEDVENVEDREVDFPRGGPLEFRPTLPSSSVSATRNKRWRANSHEVVLWDRGEDVLDLRRGGHGGKG